MVTLDGENDDEFMVTVVVSDGPDESEPHALRRITDAARVYCKRLSFKISSSGFSNVQIKVYNARRRAFSHQYIRLRPQPFSHRALMRATALMGQMPAGGGSLRSPEAFGAPLAELATTCWVGLNL